MYEEKKTLASKIWSYLINPFLKYKCKSIYLCNLKAKKYIKNPDLGIVVLFLSSLMKFPKGEEAEYYKKIITRIKDSDIPERKKYERYQEVSYLSALKPNHSETLEQVFKTMPLEIDMNKVPFYKEALATGMKEGIKEGIEKSKVEFILKLNQKKKFSAMEIAETFNLSLEEVETVLQNPNFKA